MNLLSLNLVLSITILLQFGCTTFSDAQIKGTGNGAGRADALDIRVENEALVGLEYDDPATVSNLEALLDLPAPRIRLIFGCTGEEMAAGKCGNHVTIDLPSTLHADVTAYWKETLRFYYRDQIEKFPSAQSNYDESIRFAVLVENFKEKLRATKIPTDKGERPISIAEADQIVGKLNKKSSGLVKKMDPAQK